LVKVCNELVKKVKKIWLLRQDPGWSDLIFARNQLVLVKGQTKILGPASVIWDQISGPKRANLVTL